MTRIPLQNTDVNSFRGLHSLKKVYNLSHLRKDLSRPFQTITVHLVTENRLSNKTYANVTSCESSKPLLNC